MSAKFRLGPGAFSQTISSVPVREQVHRHRRRKMGNLSRSIRKPDQYPSWKQEVNERVAAHLSRKTPSTGDAGTSPIIHPVPAGRAAQAAARVAARYANAPSYNEMLADEARAAVRAAQAASEAAQQAHAAAQSILEGLEAASDQSSWDPEAVANDRNAQLEEPEMAPQPESLAIHQEPEFAGHEGAESGVHPAEQAPVRGKSVAPRQAIGENGARDRKEKSAAAPSIWDVHNELAGGEAQPIFANLIQFPREMIATRRMRPRRDEGPLAGTDQGPQLSIFEVDPDTISVQPAAPGADEPVVPAWMRPEWPVLDVVEPTTEDFEKNPVPQVRAALVEDSATLSRRLMAIVVDAALITAVFAGLVRMAAAGAHRFHNPRSAAVAGVFVLLLIGAAYLTSFFTWTSWTPGMKYAGIELCTLDGATPVRAQRWARLMALPLSVLPLGMGLAWALFDEWSLTWHDRLSGTYLRRR
jgi:uncharacterized RDD family membrane protein YckC